MTDSFQGDEQQTIRQEFAELLRASCDGTRKSFQMSDATDDEIVQFKNEETRKAADAVWLAGRHEDAFLFIQLHYKEAALLGKARSVANGEITLNRPEATSLMEELVAAFSELFDMAKRLKAKGAQLEKLHSLLPTDKDA